MSDAERRAAIARRLMRALRQPQRRVGERALGSFVVALPDDSVADICARVLIVGGEANVVMSVGADLHLFRWTEFGPTETPIYDGVDEPQSVDPATTMGMLLELVALVPSGSHAFCVERHGGVRLTDSERLMAPA